MSAAASGLIGPWGDRTYLLPKQMVYVSSLYVRAQVNGRYLLVGYQHRAMSHLFGDTVVTTPEGLRCDVPVGDLAAGSGEIGSADDPTSVALELRLRLALQKTETMLIECQGVLDLRGGIQVVRALPVSAWTGSAFVASRHETDSPTFRWLNRRQLFGIGRVQGLDQSGSGELELSFDLYASA